MKKLFIFLLIFLLLLLTIYIYLVDKDYFVCPIEYKHDIIIRCDKLGDGYFGARRSGNRKHSGVDLLAEIGTPVKAPCLGIVVKAGQRRGMGKYIILRHTPSLSTVYGHLSEIFVRKNQIVRQGQIIGSVGKTGNAAHRNILSHLHFEVRENGIAQDPLKYYLE